MTPLQLLVRQGVGRVAGSRLSLRTAGSVLLERLNIIYYHRIGPPVPYCASPLISCPTDRFASDMDWLAGRFDIVPLEDLLHQDQTRSAQTPRVALTFDDGLRGDFDAQLEILEKHDISATSFVVTDCVGNGQLMWRNKLIAAAEELGEAAFVEAFNSLPEGSGGPVGSVSEALSVSLKWAAASKDELAQQVWDTAGAEPLADYLDRHQPYLDNEDIKQWVAAGHTIGLHSRSHPLCSGLSEAEIQREIVEPAAELRATMDAGTMLAFSYPFGDPFPEAKAQELVDSGAVDAILGSAGSVPVGSPAHQLERVGAEVDIRWAAAGRTVADRWLPGT